MTHNSYEDSRLDSFLCDVQWTSVCIVHRTPCTYFEVLRQIILNLNKCASRTVWRCPSKTNLNLKDEHIDVLRFKKVRPSRVLAMLSEFWVFDKTMKKRKYRFAFDLLQNSPISSHLFFLPNIEKNYEVFRFPRTDSEKHPWLRENIHKTLSTVTWLQKRVSPLLWTNQLAFSSPETFCWDYQICPVNRTNGRKREHSLFLTHAPLWIEKQTVIDRIINRVLAVFVFRNFQCNSADRES